MKLFLSTELLPPTHPSAFDGVAALPLIGNAPGIETLRLQLRTAGRHPRIAVIEAEPGLGEDAVARELALHAPGGARPLLLIDAAAFNAAVHRQQPGAVGQLLQGAHDGTVLLRDLPLLSPPAQHALSQLLGNPASHWVFSTQIPLRILRVRGMLLPALLRQLPTLTLRLPPLRERLSDLPLLIMEVLQQLAWEAALPVPVASEQGISLLASYAWPGNLEELKAVLRTVLLDPSRDPACALTEQHLRSALPEDAHTQPAPPAIQSQSHAQEPPTEAPLRLQDVVDHHVLQILHRCQGNKLRAAELLGVSRSTLYRILGAIAARPAE